MALSLLDYWSLLPAFAMVLARLAGLMIAAPVFSTPVIPRAVRAYFVMAMTLAVFPSVSPYVQGGLTLGDAILGMLGEFAIGATLGLGANLVLTATQLTGLVVEQQAGLAISQVLDPMTGSRASVLGEIFFIIAGLVFLAIGGERELVRVLLESFAAVPSMGFRPDATVCDALAGLLAESFVLSLQLAAPAIIALLLTATALGLLARTVPQLNVLSVGFSIKIVVAIVVFLGTFPLASSALEGAFASVFDSIRGLLNAPRV